jgi:hypothetical protein
VYAPPVTVLQLNVVAPPRIVVPGAGFVITAAFGAVVSVVIAVAVAPPPDPVIVNVVVLPAVHPLVATDTVALTAAVCVGLPATVAVGLPSTCAHVPACTPSATVPAKLAEPCTAYVAVPAVCESSDVHIDSVALVCTVRFITCGGLEAMYGLEPPTGSDIVNCMPGHPKLTMPGSTPTCTEMVPSPFGIRIGDVLRPTTVQFGLFTQV